MDEGRKRKTYDRQFKVDVVRLVNEGKRSVREVAAEIGIDPNTLYQWRRDLAKEGENAFPGKGHLTASARAFSVSVVSWALLDLLSAKSAPPACD